MGWRAVPFLNPFAWFSRRAATTTAVPRFTFTAQQAGTSFRAQRTPSSFTLDESGSSFVANKAGSSFTTYAASTTFRGE